MFVPKSFRQPLWFALAACALFAVACGGGGQQAQDEAKASDPVSSDAPLAENPCGDAPMAENPCADPNAPVSKEVPLPEQPGVDPNAPVANEEPLPEQPGVDPNDPVSNETPVPEQPGVDPSDPVEKPGVDPNDPVEKPGSDAGTPVAKPVPEEKPLPAALGNASNGEKLWGKKCKGCHGTEAKPGKLGPNVFAEKWSSARKQKKALKMIKNGEGKMPAFEGKLSAQEMNDLVAFIAR